MDANDFSFRRTALSFREIKERRLRKERLGAACRIRINTKKTKRTNRIKRHKTQ